MTRHKAPTRQAADQSCSQTHQNQGQGLGLEDPRHPLMSHEPQWGLTAQAAAVVPYLRSGTHAELDDLIAALVRMEMGYIEVLEFLGFTRETSKSILRYWVVLKLDAPTGGPYGLLGVALAAIADMGEPEVRACEDSGGGGGGTTNQSPKSEWQPAFAQVLNNEALAAVGRLGAYLAPDFSKAKQLVYHMIMRRWERLMGHT
ncbi:hypothetical protein GGS24DRAFT_211115 [Hypoxylon argillaceum]|nr:hypothetical protein GGS24DRAFT_211115 [Hypoxylon argillaceum]